MKFSHAVIEKNSALLLVISLCVVLVGGIFEILPLFFVKSTIEKVEGTRPYTPLELAGQRIYIREGCYVCHSQMIRSLRSEVDRYGHYSLAAESQYDHPFQWGSKRTGPDLARVGKKYTNEWHVTHLVNPRSVVPESIMPGYPFLTQTPLETRELKALLRTHQILGTPYTDEQVENAVADALAQANPDADLDEFETRYPDIIAETYDGNERVVTEMDALVAYLQMLGTLVDFSIYEAKDGNER